MENYYSDDESVNSFDEDFETYYESEEISVTKYNIVLCQIYNRLIHGKSKEAKYHYLTHIRLKTLDINFINQMKRLNPAIKLEIAECIYLPSFHCVSIIKTYWIRLIQRTWRKIYKEQQNIIKKRRNPTSLRYREIYGKWPNDCINYPYLKGMLSYLSGTTS